MNSDTTNTPRPDGLRGRSRRRMGLTAGALLLAGSIAGWTAADAVGTSAAAVTSAPAAAPAGASARTVGAGGDSYAPIVDRIAPAVVTIRSEKRVRNVSQELPDDPFLRQFFGERFRGPRAVPERREGALGSGVIVRADGYVLTNDHVIDGADQVRVELSDGRSVKAEVVGSDAPSDLAVLKIDAHDLQTLTLGDSDQVRVGDVVLALGNPLGVGQTVTMGIVSAKGRATGMGDGSFEDFIQTDAPINQGNSGGALVSTRGELVGINSQIVSPSGGNIGIGFAIPANMARNVMTQLIDKGRVRRGMLGVTVQPMTSELARSLGIDQVTGALVSGVQPGSPAEKSGVRRGDVITAVNGETVKDGNVLRNHVAELQPGSRVELNVLRNGKPQTLTLTLGELTPARAGSEGDEESASGRDGTGYGMAVEPLTRENASQLDLDVTSGVLVTDVQPAGRAAEAGLRSGDVIDEVDGRHVDSVDALRSALRSGDRPALLLVHRNGATMFLTLERGTKAG
jgi:serine protease Do